MNDKPHSVEFGRFVICPMSLARDDGSFDALVSIRSGSGMASVDRVMRFSRAFSSTQAALHHAREQGMAWAVCH